MKLKTIFLVSTLVLFVGILLTYTLADVVTEPRNSRAPASFPDNFETLTGCNKQAILWENIRSTAYTQLPDYRKLGLLQIIAMGKQELGLKGSAHSDFAPEGWKKYLHGRGAIAKVKIVPKSNKYTGVFQGAECALLRLSLTYRTSGSKPVAPGLALKVFRDGVYSANISALVSLDGQGKDFNFFKYPMSNIVPIGQDFGQKLVHSMFSKVSRYPEELLTTEMATIDSQGIKASKIVAPRQIFFVPGRSFSFSSNEHDVRNDFASLPTGTAIYQLYLLSGKYNTFDYTNYTPEDVTKFLSDAEYAADLVTTSEFISSEFGDDGIFFRHQLRPK